MPVFPSNLGSESSRRSIHAPRFARENGNPGVENRPVHAIIRKTVDVSAREVGTQISFFEDLLSGNHLGTRTVQPAGTNYPPLRSLTTDSRHARLNELGHSLQNLKESWQLAGVRVLTSADPKAKDLWAKERDSASNEFVKAYREYDWLNYSDPVGQEARVQREIDRIRSRIRERADFELRDRAHEKAWNVRTGKFELKPRQREVDRAALQRNRSDGIGRPCLGTDSRGAEARDAVGVEPVGPKRPESRQGRVEKRKIPEGIRESAKPKRSRAESAQATDLTRECEAGTKRQGGAGEEKEPKRRKRGGRKKGKGFYSFIRPLLLLLKGLI